jgi:hypothetical protein
VSIHTRIRTTPESFVGYEEVQDQRQRSHLIHEVVNQLDVPTLLTLDVKADLLTGLLEGKQGWKCPVVQSLCHVVIDPVFKEGFFPR